MNARLISKLHSASVVQPTDFWCVPLTGGDPIKAVSFTDVEGDIGTYCKVEQIGDRWILAWIED